LLGFSVAWDAAQVSGNEIVEKSKSLASIKSRIEDKRNQEKKYLSDEKRISRELDLISGELDKLQKEREKLRKAIVKAVTNLAFSEREMKVSRWEKNKWNEQLNKEADLWFRDTIGYGKFFDNGIDEKLRVQALQQKKSFFSDAQLREDSWQKALLTWQNSKNRLNHLKLEKEANAKKKSAVLAQKKKLLLTTVGRRLAAGKEIKELNESAKALSALIERLEEERRRAEREARRKPKGRRAKARPQPLRRALAWPVSGKVVSRFGKNKHPDLDTYIISNGIKIKTKPHTEVKAAAGGEVVFIGEFRTYGLMVIVDNGGGLYTIYGHMGAVNVTENARVFTGEPLGQITSTENPLLYFEVRYDGQPDDPLLWLNKK